MIFRAIQLWAIICIIGFTFKTLVDRNWESKKEQDKLNNMSEEEIYQKIMFGGTGGMNNSYCNDFLNQTSCENNGCTWEWFDDDNDGYIRHEEEGICF